MNTLSSWFAMGGYGWYVWLSYGAGIVVIALNLWLPLRGHRHLSTHPVPDRKSGKN